MTTLFDCSLNGTSLSSLDESICVLDIREDAPKMRTSSLTLQPDGRRILSQARDSLTVHVVFAIHQEDPALRRDVLKQVNAWALGVGPLTVSDRPGQILEASCTALPESSGLDWQEEMTLTFTASSAPYWQDLEPAFVAGVGAQTLEVPGTAPSTPVDVLVINTSSETVSYIKFYCGGSQIILDGLTFPPSSFLIASLFDGVFDITVNGQSVLCYRTPESADSLVVPCGASSTVYVNCPAGLSGSFTARGRYL